MYNFAVITVICDGIDSIGFYPTYTDALEAVEWMHDAYFAAIESGNMNVYVKELSATELDIFKLVATTRPDYML